MAITSRFKMGLWFNGKHSTELGVDMLTGGEIGFPEKSKSIISVPYANSPIDLSLIYANVQTYEQRQIKKVFMIRDRANLTRIGQRRVANDVVNWVESSNSQTPLILDEDPDYYFLAEVQTAPTLEEFDLYGTLTIEWTCYPFRVHRYSDTSDVWDTFDFDNDIAHISNFIVNGTAQLIYLNTGQSVLIPDIVVVDGAVTLTFNDKSIALSVGTYHSWDIGLQPGINYFQFSGHAHVKVDYYREVI